MNVSFWSSSFIEFKGRSITHSQISFHQAWSRMPHEVRVLVWDQLRLGIILFLSHLIELNHECITRPSFLRRMIDTRDHCHVRLTWSNSNRNRCHWPRSYVQSLILQIVVPSVSFDWTQCWKPEAKLIPILDEWYWRSINLVFHLSKLSHEPLLLNWFRFWIYDTEDPTRTFLTAWNSTLDDFS